MRIAREQRTESHNARFSDFFFCVSQCIKTQIEYVNYSGVVFQLKNIEKKKI